MKTLHVVPSIDVERGAGLGASALALHRQMLEDGFKSRLLTTGILSYHPPGVETLPLAVQNPFFYDPRNRHRLDSETNASDIIQQHGLYTHLNWCVGEVSAARHKPLVYHPQGTLSPWYLRRRRLLKKAVHVVFEDRNFRRVPLWRATTEQEVSEIRSFVPQAKIVVVPNGIHPEDFPDRPDLNDKTFFKDLDSTRRWLLFLGRLSPVKGIDLLIAAWAGLSQYHGDWQLVIVGPDTEGYRHKVSQQASAFSSKAMPRFTRRLLGEEKLRMLNASDLFILPSRAEGFSVAVLEAMATRKPVILSDACNFREVQSEGAGWICRGEVDSVRSALLQALGETELALKERGTIARSLVMRKYTWQTVSGILNEAVRSL